MDTLHAKSGCIYIIGCLLRPGALSFAVDLEHKYFEPDTDRNDLYQIFHVKYQNMPWYIIEIPADSFDITDKLATECKLRLVQGKPMSGSMGSGSGSEFSLLCSADHCFTLESTEHKSNWQAVLKEEQQRVRERLKMNDHVSLDE